MKREAFDIFKVIVLLIATSLLVMAYTTIERSVASPAAESTAVVPGITPVAVALLEKPKDAPVLKKTTKAGYLVLINRWHEIKRNDKNGCKTRYTLVLL